MDCSNTIRTGTGTPSIGAKAERWSLNRVKTELAGGGRRLVDVGRQVEGEAAGEDGGERLRVEVEAAGVDRQVDPARVPEPGLARDELLVRRFDEDVDRQLVAVGVEHVADDTADPRAAMEHR
jgi:hypothetical protein